MQKIVLVAVALFGLATPSLSQAAPVSDLTILEAPDHVEQIKKGGHGYKGHKGWGSSRHWDHGHGYGRYYGGPPPHARAFGRRARDFGYYRYW